MENATKALIMAAGILIGIIVLSIFAYEFIVISNTGEQYGQEIRRREITEFNSQFEAYAYVYTYDDVKDPMPRRLKAQEVATLLYLISDWNKNNESDQITISLKDGINNKYGSEDNFMYGNKDDFKYESFLSEKSIIKIDEEHSNYSVFACYIDSYDQDGRINGISIKETGKMIRDKDGNETFKKA